MKKNFAYLAITLFMGLFASCSQENDPTTSNSRNKLVNISAELPKEFAQHVPFRQQTDITCVASSK